MTDYSFRLSSCLSLCGQRSTGAASVNVQKTFISEPRFLVYTIFIYTPAKPDPLQRIISFGCPASWTVIANKLPYSPNTYLWDWTYCVSNQRVVITPWFLSVACLIFCCSLYALIVGPTVERKKRWGDQKYDTIHWIVYLLSLLWFETWTPSTQVATNLADSVAIVLQCILKLLRNQTLNSANLVLSRSLHGTVPLNVLLGFQRVMVL